MDNIPPGRSNFHKSPWNFWPTTKNLVISDLETYTYGLFFRTGRNRENGILLPKLFWPTVRKKISSDREKLLKFEAEGQEFGRFLRSLEQFVQTEKESLVPKCFFNLLLEIYHI